MASVGDEREYLLVFDVIDPKIQPIALEEINERTGEIFTLNLELLHTTPTQIGRILHVIHRRRRRTFDRLSIRNDRQLILDFCRQHFHQSESKSYYTFTVQDADFEPEDGFHILPSSSFY